MTKKSLSWEDKFDKMLHKLKRLKIHDENHLLFISFVIVMVAMLMINTIFVINRVPQSILHPRLENQVELAPSNVLTSQQKANSKASTVSISNVFETDTFDPAFTLAPTDTLLVMDISITNQTSGDQNLFPANQFYVRTRDGDYSTLHVSLNIKHPLNSAVVHSGQTVKGQISFNVPKRASHPLVYVDLGWNDFVPVVFDALR